jgi:hypothetical protein
MQALATALPRRTLHAWRVSALRSSGRIGIAHAGTGAAPAACRSSGHGHALHFMCDAFPAARQTRRLCSSTSPGAEALAVSGGGAAASGASAASALDPGSLVVVALRDGAKAPRRLAVIKGAVAGSSGHVLLEMDSQQEVAVRRQSIKMALPPPAASAPCAHDHTDEAG